MNPLQEYSKSSFYYLELLAKWKKQFAILSIFAIVASIIFSSPFFIKPKYKSFAIVYPSNITPYGDESPAEQMIQFLEAADIRNTIVQKFNLVNRYGIDSTSKISLATLVAAYESNVTVRRTQYESVEIQVLDTDPRVACDMVNAIIAALNLKIHSVQKEKSQEVLTMLTNQLDSKRKLLDSLDSSLKELRVKYQILDYDIQAKEVVKGYVKVLSEGKGINTMKDIDVMMKNMEEKGGEYYKTKTIYDGELLSYTKVKLEYDLAFRNTVKTFSFTNMVTAPFPLDKKTYPIRWLIILVSVIAANLFLYLVIVVRDLKKK